jgi:hypothetical protein
MSQKEISHTNGRVIAAAVEHDQTRIWLLHEPARDPVQVIEREEVQHTHMRGGQERHQHSSEVNEVPYFANVLNALDGASHVVLMGHGAGNSNTASRLVEYANSHHSTLKDRIITAGPVDFSALSNGQLLALAMSVWERQ